MENEVLTVDLMKENIALKSKVSELETLVKFYEEQFLLSKKRQFGVSSEKSEYDQLRLGVVDSESDENIVSSEEPALAVVKEHIRKKRTRKDRLPEDLPVEEIVCELPPEEQSCLDCGNEMHVMGRKAGRDELVVIPAKVMIRRYVTCTYACRECAKSSEHSTIRSARAPQSVIKGSYASPESVAFAAYQKFAMGVPLYRQEQDWERQGVLLSRQTMANWLMRCADDWLKPLVDELGRRILLREVLHADETTLQVLKEPGKQPERKSYLWCYRTSGDTDEPIVVAQYKPDRKACNPENFLAGFSGYLHTDGYDAYHKLPGNITVVGCWAHVRRKWDEALKIVSPSDRNGSKPMIGKQYCDKLFAIERELASFDASERYEQRVKRLKPLIDEFYAWADNVQARPKSALGKAISYMFSQQKYLRSVLLDGRLELSNNRAERTIKPFVISRKNFLFANTPNGADAAACIFSLIETAKETGVNPFDYLVYVFKMAPSLDLSDAKVIQELLPSGYKKFYCL